MCRKGRNKICYIRHIFSVFLKITPKFRRDLLRSLDGFYSEVWTDFTPKFGRDLLRSLDGIYSEVWTEFTPKFGRVLLRSLDGIHSEVWTGFTPKFGRDLLRSLDGMGKVLRKSAEVFSTQIERIERTVFETLMFKNCLTKCR